MDKYKILTSEKLAELKSYFDNADDDMDGIIDLSDLGDSLRAFGLNPTKEDIEDIFSDCSGSNDVNFQTFAYVAFRLMRNNSVKDNLLAAFRLFDKNGSGCIETDKLVKIFNSIDKPLTDDQIERLLSKLYIDNGFINYEEAINTWTSDDWL